MVRSEWRMIDTFSATRQCQLPLRPKTGEIVRRGRAAGSGGHRSGCSALGIDPSPDAATILAMSKSEADEVLASAKDVLRDTMKQLLEEGGDPREHLLVVIAGADGTTVGVCSLAEYARQVVMNDGPASLSDWLENPLPPDHQRVIVMIDDAAHPYAVPFSRGPRLAN